MNLSKIVEMAKAIGRTRIGKEDMSHASRYRRKKNRLVGTGRYEPRPENRVAEDDEPKKPNTIDTEPKIMSFVGQSR